MTTPTPVIKALDLASLPATESPAAFLMGKIEELQRDLAAREEELARVKAEYANSIAAWTGIEDERKAAEQRAEAAEQLAAQRLTDVEIAERHADTATAAMHAAERERDDERTIVNRIWEQLGAPSYASLSGRSIYDLIAGLQADRDEWKRKAEENARDAELMREVNRAAEHLPEGNELTITVERGAAWVSLFDVDAGHIPLEEYHGDNGLAGELAQATDAAIAAKGEA